MYQSVIVLSFAFAFSLFGTAVTAKGASRERRRARVAWVAACGAASVVSPYAITAGGLRVNFTPSAPLGIYRLVPIPTGRLQRGMLVEACAPLNAATLGRRRGYLSAGSCPAGTEPLLKTVAAVVGDVLTISADGVVVNGHLLVHSKPAVFDRAGRQLSPWPFGHYHLTRDHIWLYADHVRSWDCRYWGPAPVRNVLAMVIPLITVASVRVYERLPHLTSE
jgi:conjugative transfer signal peptidase TraF